MTSDKEACRNGADDGTQYAIPPDPKLLAEGWVRRYLAEPARAEEAVELYTSLGYEVKAHKLTPSDFGPMCGECPATICRTYVMIYTRKPAAGETGGGD